jgi:hypothetical protein
LPPGSEECRESGVEKWASLNHSEKRKILKNTTKYICISIPYGILVRKIAMPRSLLLTATSIALRYPGTGSRASINQEATKTQRQEAEKRSIHRTTGLADSSICIQDLVC